VLPTYPPTYLPFPHFPISERQLSTKKATPRHTYVHSLVLKRRPRASNTQFSLEPAGVGVRCGAVRYACKQQHPDIRPRIPTRPRAKAAGSAQSHDCGGGLACREVLRRWMASVAFSSARLSSRRRLGAYVCMRVRDVCRRGGCRAGRLGVLVYGG
jgi:hypothetical protein